MLDNLKLGYGGTKKEMERLIEDANKVKKANGEMANLSINSFADMVEAIHIIQKEMGITGTTALEAEKTIQGSTSSMKSAWQNLLTGIADSNQDLGKLVNNFVDSVITASKNLVPRVKTVVEGIKKLVMSIVKEVFPKLKKEIPELKPLITTFEWFIKNKSLVVNSIKLMVAAFAITKINQFTKSLTDTTKKIIEIATKTTVATAATNANTAAQAANTTAQVAGTTATNALTVATNLLNTAWRSNPIGLVITGVTTLISVFALLKNSSNQVTEAEKERRAEMELQRQAVEDSKRAWEDLIETQQNSINTGMTEVSHYQSLYDELETIVDANGKVKKGYEARASFITTTLADALGVEIKMVDGVIQGYGNLTKSIDKVMEKKKAEIILQAQEEAYTQAINNRTAALMRANELEIELADQKYKRDTLQLYLDENRLNMSYSQIGAITDKIKKMDEEISKTESTYNEQQDLLAEYAYNVGVYEKNMALAHEEKYNEMTTVTWDLVKEYQKAGDAEKAQLEEQIRTEELNLNLLKGLKEKTGKDIYDQQIKDGEKQLEELNKQLDKYKSTTEEKLNETEIVWNDSLGEQLSDITGSSIKFKEGADGNVTMYINGLKAGEPKSKEEMAKLVTKTIKEITEKENDAKAAGEDLIDGVNRGIKNQNKQNGVFSAISNFGNTLLQKLKNSLKEKSPSKATNEMGQYLLEGLGLGIEEEENSVYKQVTSFGKNVLSSLSGSLNKKLSLPRISVDNVNAASISNLRKNTGNEAAQSIELVNSFKQALSEMKIELDDENVGKFVDNKVTKLIYT